MKKVFLLGLLALSTASATKYPLTVTDDLGRKIVIPKEPQRIVVMLPSHMETLYALGVANKVVGVDKYSSYPKAVVEKLPKVGTAYTPDIEKIVALKPDLVLADDSSKSRLTQKLADAGLTVYGGTAQSYNDVFKKMAIVGKMVNRERQATKLTTDLRSELNTLQAKIKKSPVRSVYYEVSPTPHSVGPDSFIGVLIGKAGGKTIVPAKMGDFPKLDPEMIVKANPQVMVGQSLTDAATRPGWQNLQALKNKRVYTMTEEEKNILSRPGPRLAEALKLLIGWIHPEALK